MGTTAESILERSATNIELLKAVVDHLQLSPDYTREQLNEKIDQTPDKHLSRLLLNINTAYSSEYFDNIAKNSNYEGPADYLHDTDTPEFHEAMKNIKEALKRSLFLLPLLGTLN